MATTGGAVSPFAGVGVEETGPDGSGAHPRPGLLHRLHGPLVTAGALGAATVAVLVRDPHRPGSWGWCSFLSLTGLPCPVCGGLRAVNDLLHGDVVAAVSGNALVVVIVLLTAVVLGVWTVRRLRGSGVEQPPLLTRAVGTAVLVVTVLFTVLRWTPAGAWLQP